MEDNYKKKFLKGSFWSFIEKLFTQFTSLVVGIILARLLTPADYGFVGILNVIIIFTTLFVEGGMSRVLIQKKDRTEADYVTIFIFNIIISIILYIVIFVSSPLIAKYYEKKEIILALRVLAVILFINSLTIVQNAKLQIAMDFKSLAKITFFANLISGIIAIILAYRNLGYWALIIQQISRSILLFLLYVVLFRWKPNLRLFSLKLLKNIFGFSLKLLTSSVISRVYLNIRDLIIGKKYALESLGFYTRGKNFSDIALGVIDGIFQSTSFSTLSKIDSNESKFSESLAFLVKCCLIISLPAFLGLAACSNEIIFLLLTKKWINSVPFLFCFALANTVVPVEGIILNSLNALGRPNVFLKALFIKLPIDTVILLISIQISPLGIAIGLLINSFISLFIDFLISSRHTGYSFIKFIRNNYKIISSALIMFAIVMLVGAWNIPQLIKLILKIFIGIIVYTTSLFIFRESLALAFYIKIKEKFVQKKLIKGRAK